MHRNVVLIGGGHAHVEVIRRWAKSPVPGVSLSVVDPNPRSVYSGMVPGFVAGQYAREELEIDLAALCARAGASYIAEPATRIDPMDHRVRLAGGNDVPYAIVSIDIGSTVAGGDLPGVREFGLPSRPIASFVSQVDDLLSKSRNSAGPLRIHVVGSGAGGIELAFCLDHRLRGMCNGDLRINVVTSDTRVLEGAPDRFRRRVQRAAQARGIASIVDSGVAAIRQDAIELESGISLASNGVLWVTGPASPPLARASGLPVDDKGFIRIEPSLRVVGHERIFAVGDCASLHGMKKAGVYAVRTGPLIAENIRASLAEQPLRGYKPQGDFLSLLNLGDGTAIGSKWGFSFEGKSVMRLKDRIDRSFMERYR